MKAKTKTKNHLKKIIKATHKSVKMAVVPNKKNDYRPHLIRKYGMAIIIFLVIGLQIAYNLSTVGEVMGVESNITIASLLEKTNKARIESGVGSLSLNNKLNESALLKAQDMLANQYWAHTSPEGVDPWKWFETVDYEYVEAGENLAKGFYLTDAVMMAWMNSPDHKKNIVNPNYKEVGFAVVSGEFEGRITSLIVAHYGVEATNVITDIKSAFSQPEITGDSSSLTRFAVALRSITPAGIIALMLIGVTIIVSAFAHVNHDKISKAVKHSFKRHHGLYKAVGMGILGLFVIWLYGGGQI